MSDPTTGIHPIVAVASDIRSLLKSIAGVNPTFMTTDDKACALGELVRAEGQLVELRLRVLADAGDLAESTAAKDAGGLVGASHPDPVHSTRVRTSRFGDRAGPGNDPCWQPGCATAT